MKDIICFKYYDGKKRRLAIKAVPIDEEHTEITIITCSKHDQFSKKEAYNGFSCMELGVPPIVNNSIAHPQKIIIAHYGEFRKSFFEWANSTYFKRYDDVRRVVMSVLYGHGVTIMYEKPKTVFKL